MHTGDNLDILEKIRWKNNPYAEVVDGHIERTKRIQANTTREKLIKLYHLTELYYWKVYTLLTKDPHWN